MNRGLRATRNRGKVTADLADLFDRFREQQTVHGGKVTADDKRSLRDKLSALSLELDRYLARDYGIDPDKAKAFATWRESHQPFHWFAEFYGGMREGGFDVVIGNPPYLEVREVEYGSMPFCVELDGSMPFCVELDNLKDTDAPIHQPAAMLVAAD